MKTAARRALLSLLVTTSLASAQTTLPEFSLERFAFNPGQGAALSGATGEVLEGGSYRAFVALHYEHDPLVLYDDSGRLVSAVGHRLTTHLGGAYGITSWAQVSGELPIVVFQTGSDLQRYGSTNPASAGVSGLMLQGRLSLLSQKPGALISTAGFDLAFELGLTLPLASTQAFVRESGWNVVPRISAGRDFGPLRAGAELGGFVRFAQANLDSTGNRSRVGTQLGLNLTVVTTKQLLEAARFEVSARLGFPLAAGTTPVGGEVLAGARVPIGEWFEVFALVGPGFGHLAGTPSVRALVGVGLQPPEDICKTTKPRTPEQCPLLDDDRDGVPNGVDRCPLVAEDADHFQDEDGCPEDDNDHDGLLDAADECPLVAGVKAYKGCPPKDADRDGIDDLSDACPNEAGLKERKGCPIRDADGDGVEDEVDACPKVAGLAARKGCPLPDKDKDGVEDTVDNCPEVAGSPDNQGCPKDQQQLVVITGKKLIIKDKVYFATGKSAILDKSFKLLDQIAAVINGHPELRTITVEGHTDNVGKPDTNKKLSQGRADAVRQYLIKQKVAGARLKAIGYGQDRPQDTNATEAGRGINRRVEFTISDD